MGDPNWTLIETLSRRFDQLVGIASQDQLRRLLDNFHVVHHIAHGSFDEILNAFFVAKAQDIRRPGRLLEQLRHYELSPGRVKFLSALLEAAEIGCEGRVREMVERKVASMTEDGQRKRCKLVRFDAAVSLRDVHAACQKIGLAPARLPNLIQFVDEYPDSVPERLLGAGSAALPKGEDRGDVGIPSIARRKGGRRFDLSLFPVHGIEARTIDTTAVFLAERIPLRDATDDAEPVAPQQESDDEYAHVWRTLGLSG